MENSGLSDIEVELQFGELLKDFIEDWSEDEDSVYGDSAGNVNQGEDINVSAFYDGLLVTQ
jgi:hypothetical protein